MSVPEEIRKVKRPVNTVVVDSGSKGLKRYAVRKRNGFVYEKGTNPRPHNGKVVGHIIVSSTISSTRTKPATPSPSS